MIYEIRLKVYLMENIINSEMMEHISKFVDASLGKSPDFIEFHNKNQFKYYCISGFYPIEKDGIYKRDNIYTITIRTVDKKLGKYFLEVLENTITSKIKGLRISVRILPPKFIGEIYSLLPVIIKSEEGYWRNTMNLEQYERRLFENAVKKYHGYTGEKLDEDFQFYTNIIFLNRKPIPNGYKKIKLLGDKINLKIADNKSAQKLAYFLLGTGLGEVNSRGYGFCNFRWI